MTVDASSGTDDRRPLTIRLSVEQKRWLMNEALDRRCAQHPRCTQNDVVVDALIAAGAPST
jgi:hypothetical protein